LVHPGSVVLDRYRILEQIATGGLSVIFHGEDLRLRRDVAVKVFHGVEDPAKSRGDLYRVQYEHFVQEAFALSRLRHPNTLRILDFGYLEKEGGGRRVPVQISEFMDGGTLRRLVFRRGPLDLAPALKIIEVLCDALVEAHALGIVHRDIKPRNILVSTVGRRTVVKLADFGIAQVFWQPADARPPRMYSINWAAPEQLEGRQVTPATDVYALALVTLYMLTGSVLFDAVELRAACAQRGEAAARAGAALALRGVRGDSALTAFIQKACSPEVEERPATVEAFFAKLVAACRGITLKPLRPRRKGPAESIPSMVSCGPQQLEPGATVTVGEREVSFVDGADATGGEFDVGEARLRAALLHDAGGAFCLQLRGLNCFVRLPRRAPALAVHLREPQPLELVLPDHRTVASATVQFAERLGAQSSFNVDDRTVVVADEHCEWIVGLDFGATEPFRLVYRATRGAAQQAWPG
jgi:serine/threonine-protein kinase